jgi:hypothetical protein
MYRIDNDTVVPTLPAPGPPGIQGFYSDGNETTGTPATIVDAWWLNMIQEEIRNRRRRRRDHSGQKRQRPAARRPNRDHRGQHLSCLF